MRCFLLPLFIVLLAGRVLAQPTDLLPGSKPARTAEFTLWLVAPTDRYPHGALGGQLEAGALQIDLHGGRVQRLVAPPDAVFEDRHPRAVVVDGRAMVMTVLSTRGAGAALVLVGLTTGEAAIVARSPPIGTANRWLNPIGAADVDGDGQTELLAVRTPHIGGVLEVWQVRGADLMRRWSWPGVSNHVYGSAAQGRSALRDVDGDGIADVVLPTQDGRALVAIGFAGGAPHEAARWPLDAPVAGDFTTTAGRLTVPLANGGRFQLPP